MDFNNTQSPQNTQVADRPQGGYAPNKQNNSSGYSFFKSIVAVSLIALVVIALVGAAVFMNKDKTSGMAGVQKERYQAVFLTNGQVYFGKIQEMNKDRLKLDNIYYLQVQQSVQPADQKEGDNQISLVKLGDELHGPEDAMYISKDQMLFWENLKDSGKVVQAIQKAGQK